MFLTGVGDRHRVCGFLSLCGTVTARAVGYTKEPLARVIAYLKVFFSPLCAGSSSPYAKTGMRFTLKFVFLLYRMILL